MFLLHLGLWQFHFDCGQIALQLQTDFKVRTFYFHGFVFDKLIHCWEFKWCCVISYRAGTWHYRIFADFSLKSKNFKMSVKNGKTVRASWHWSCASKYCKNSWKTPKVGYYSLTKVGSAPKTVQDAYLEVLGKRKEDVNFKKQVICSKHW